MMDEYSPKRHDIAQLKFLCENLYNESIATLDDSYYGWVNDPGYILILRLTELIEHIASFTMNYKIKHIQDENSDLIDHTDAYLDDTYILFSNDGIDIQDLQRWQSSSEQLFNIFAKESMQWQVHPGHSFQ